MTMPHTSRPPLNQRRRQGGIAAVEFAICVLVLLVVAAGLVEIGRAFWYYDALLKGTRDAARHLSAVPFNGLAAGRATASQMVVDAALAGGVPGFTASQVSIDCSPLPCTSAAQAADIRQIAVGVSYPLPLGQLFPLPGGVLAENVTLSPRTTMPYLW